MLDNRSAVLTLDYALHNEHTQLTDKRLRTGYRLEQGLINTTHSI